jgi:hypothetical protein
LTPQVSSQQQLRIWFYSVAVITSGSDQHHAK